MKQKMEKISILSLSLLLLSTYSISAALPAMEGFYSSYSRAAVEQLISITSFAMMMVIMLNTWIAKYISQRTSVILGITMMAVCGSVPVFVQDYKVVLVTRVLLGVGIGLINSHAINLINERYEGKERAALLGYRSAAEVLGNAVLTLIAGWLLTFGWTRAYLIYLAGIPVLILFLCFVPKQAKGAEDAEKTGKTDLADTKGYRAFLVSTFALGFLTIGANSCITMRIPTITLERSLGTDAQSSMVLSLMMVTGIVAGVGFGKVTQLFGHRMMAVCMLLLAVGMVILAGSGHMIVLTIGAMVSGLAYNLLVTVIFHRVSTRLPQNIMSIGTTCGLVGCNLGASAAPYIMNLISLVDDSSHGPFLVYAVVSAVLGIFLLFSRNRD